MNRALHGAGTQCDEWNYVKHFHFTETGFRDEYIQLWIYVNICEYLYMHDNRCNNYKL